MLAKTKITSDFFLSVNVIDIWKQLKKEPISFWFFCGYVFFEYVRPQGIYTFIDILPWSKIFVISALVSSFSNQNVAAYSSSMTKYYLGLMLTVIISAIFAEYPGVAFKDINVALNWLVVYWLFIRIVTTRFRFFIVFLLIMLASYKMSQHAAIAWALNGFAFDRWGVSGAPGFFGNGGDFGVQLLIFLPLSYVFFVNCYTLWGLLKKCFFVFAPITAVMAIIATGQRNTIVGLIAILIFSLLFSNQKIRSAILIVIFTFIIFFAAPQKMIDRFYTAGLDETSQSRLLLWERGFEFFESSPMLGIGYNNWVPHYKKLYPNETFNGLTLVAHSTPVTILAELGIFGFVFYYGLVVKVFFINFQSMKLASCFDKKIWKSIPFALNLGLVGFLFASIFLSVAFYPFLFVQSSMSAALHNIYSRKNI